MNETELLRERIADVLTGDRRLDRYGSSDESVLTYVYDKLDPAAIDARGESEGTSVTHLKEVAKMRLAAYDG